MASEIHASVEIDLAAKKYADGLTRMADVTKSQSSRMMADLDATAKATDRLASGTNKAAQRMMMFGGVSHQLQDVAVQLQNGTKFATVFAQQGSQLASAFGPQGAILGGAIAIGAAIYTWVTGAAKANEEFKEGEKRLKAMQAATSDLLTGAKADEQAGVLASVKDPQARDLMKLRLDFEKDIADIREKGEKSTDKAAMNQAIAARTFRYEQERGVKEAERFAKIAEDSAKKQKDADAVSQRTKDAKTALFELGLTPEQKMMRLAGQAGFEPGNSEESRARQAEKMVELAKLGQQINQDNQDTQKKSDADAAKAQEKRIEGFDKMNKLIEEAKQKEKDLMGQLGEIQKEQQKAAIDAQADKGQAFLDNMARREAGVSDADVRKAKIQEQNAQKRAIDRQLAKEGVGQGLSGKEREDARSRRREEIADEINKAKNRDKLKAEIDGDSIQKLVDKLSQSIDRIITR